MKYPEPDSTVYFPFGTYDVGTGASLTMTGLTLAKIKVYKNGGTTQRASTAGFVLLDTGGIDFDGIVGIHGVSIDLSDDTTADFWAVGAQYFVVIDAVTVDGQTVSLIVGEFEIRSATPTVGETAHAVWDEIISKAEHDIAKSAGKILRGSGAFVIVEDTAQSGGTGNNQIQLNGDASSVDGTYDPSRIVLIGGTGIGQTRNILQYDGATKTATVDRNWKVNPDDMTEYIILGDAGREHVNEGLARGGTLSTITLNALASGDDDAYKDQVVFIRSGTGDDQSRVITAYDGTTKIATVTPDWGVLPDGESGYVMLPIHAHEPISVAAAVLDAAVTGRAEGSLGKAVEDTESDAAGTKLKTDQLTFTDPGKVDGNAKAINDKTITGTGQIGDLFVVSP